MIAREDPPGRRQLVGYVVPAPGTGIPAAAGLRDHLAATLPDYMIPATYTSVDALPLTPNGKLDRRALPAPGIPSPRRTTPRRGPPPNTPSPASGRSS